MKRFWLIIAYTCLTIVVAQAQIISQYIETNSGSYPKGIEIWNETGGELDFSANTLDVLVGVNGGAPSSVFTLSSGTLAAGDVIVIGTTGAPSLQTITESNGSVFYYEPFTFNGDDAIVIKFGGDITDMFGLSGVDPGSAWTASGVSSANQNIQLLSSVSTGDADGWTDPSSRFEVVSADPFNNQDGFGIAPGSSDTTPPSFNSTYPKSQSVIATGFDVAVNIDEIGTSYFVVLADGASAPSSSQVKLGTDAGGGGLAAGSKGTISCIAANTEYIGSASSLSSSTAYDVYVVAEDDEGSPNLQAAVTKIDVSTAAAAFAPACTSNTAINVDHDSATLRAYVNPNNASTTVTFEYGLTDSYGDEVAADQSPLTGSTSTAVSAGVTGLSASSTYHFRVKAVNSEGTSYGSDQTLGTSAAPVAPSVGHVYITEVSDATAYQNEFIELFNNTDDAIDLSASKIIRSGYVFDFSDGSGDDYIPAHGLIVIARGNSKASFESEWGALPSGVNYNTGHGNLYFGTGTSYQWVLKYGGTADTDDGTTIDDAGQVVGGTGKRHYQSSVGTWVESTPASATPGETEGTQDTSLPVELSIWKASSSQGLVKLFWTTDSEIENQGFIIERRQEGQTASDQAWKEIASFATNDDLLGQGSTSAQNDYFFIDKQVKVGQTYSYRLSDVDYRGNVTQHAAIDVTVKDAGKDLKPSDIKLHDAFPNPFNPSVNLSFTLEKEAAALSLEIFDVQGALVQTLSSGYQNMGTHDFNWDGHDGQGNAVPSGVYLVRLGTASLVQIQRVTLLR